MSSLRVCACAVSAALVLLPGAALASHGRAGLWEGSSTTQMTGMKLPPEVLAQMKAHGGAAAAQAQTYTTRFCMTQADVNNDQPPPASNRDCKVANAKISGNTYSADMVCSGRTQANGHMTVTYDSDTHYSGRMSMAMNGGGQPMTMSSSFEGKWLQADCGKVKPYSATK